MTIFIVSFVVTFVYIFLKATQQLNVVRGMYALVMPTSIGMGLCEVGMVLMVVHADSIALGVVNGVAGGLGCMLAMKFHIFKSK